MPFITLANTNQVISDLSEASTYYPSILRSPSFGENIVPAYKTDIGKQKVQSWNHIDRFKSHSQVKNNHVLFCGGAVRTLDWVPMPNKDDNQFLAITSQHSDAPPYLINSTPTKSCLQMWRMRIKDNSIQLQYIVALDNGPIRCLAFCPSGGWDVATNRLAIAAIPTISGDIQLMALPNENSVQLGAMLRVSPSVVLQSSHKCGQVMCIAWSKVTYKCTRLWLCNCIYFFFGVILDKRAFAYCCFVFNRPDSYVEFVHSGQSHV